MKFTKILIISFILIALVSIGAFSQDTHFGVGIQKSGSLEGVAGEFEAGRFTLGLLVGNNGFFLKDPTIEISTDYKDSTGYTNSDSETIFPVDGETLSVGLFAIGFGIRGEYAFIEEDFFDVYTGIGLNVMFLNLDGEYGYDEYGSTITVEGSITMIESPLFVGIDFKPFQRVPGLEFGIEVGYSVSWITSIEGSITDRYVYSDKSWDEYTTSINVDPNTKTYGTYAAASIMYRF
ncbi:hypothetical protein KAS08_00405 [Candidatus Pacearchaeota archaeon]|nr:hypothetical protein [Candidatus Pacearchaeota archaeon]